jgi:lysophospholipase L1-like esterase
VLGRRSAIDATAMLACAAAVLGLSGCLWSGDDEPEVEPGQRLIVSIGDSVAAGQGNPAPSEPEWLSHRCYRSTLSGHWIAAREVIEANPSADLGLASLACSGATIDEGLLGEQKTRLLREAERPQLERLAELARRARLVALLLSIGANDVGFARIVGFCATRPDCPDRRDYGPAEEWAQESSQPVPTLRSFVALQIARLREDYGRVAEAIPSEIPDRRVLIVEYFDPTRWPTRTQCAIFRREVLRLPIDDLVTREESRWAHDQVLLPLNRAIRAAAGDYDWTVVEGVDETFDGHGICAPRAERWVRTLHESLTLQHDHRGTLHPNEDGHRAIASLIVPVLEGVLRPEPVGE